MKICWTCKEDKPLSEYGKNSRKKDGHQGYCRECGKKKDKKLYLTSPTRKQRIAQRGAEVYKRNRKFIIECLLKHPCLDCGESNPLYLDFDHVRGEKMWNLSEMTKHSLETVESEIAKCEIRCMKCHRRKTAIEQKWKWAEPYL